MAISSQTARPAHPMNVGIQICREVIVDDIGQVLDVKPSCSYISGHQDLSFARFPISHGFLQHFSTSQHLTCRVEFAILVAQDCLQFCFVEFDNPGAAQLAEESMQDADLGG